MPKIIAWDTSQKSGMVVAVETSDSDPYKIHSQWSFNAEAFHSERLLWALDKTLESSSWSLKDVDAFGVGLGPGSFTGLRIGVTTARTLAHTLKKPVYGFSSLSGFAYEALRVFKSQSDLKKVLCLTAIEGAKGQVFLQIGRGDLCSESFIPSVEIQDGIWKKEVLELAIEPENINNFIQKYKKKYLLPARMKVIYLGPGWRAEQLKSGLPEFLSNKVSPEGAAFFSVQGWKILKKAEPLQLFPRYLRASYAEVQKTKKASSIAILN